jgi:hypothetical protein
MPYLLFSSFNSTSSSSTFAGLESHNALFCAGHTLSRRQALLFQTQSPACRCQLQLSIMQSFSRRDISSICFSNPLFEISKLHELLQQAGQFFDTFFFGSFPVSFAF